jgi:hypothetical protein
MMRWGSTEKEGAITKLSLSIDFIEKVKTLSTDFVES